MHNDNAEARAPIGFTKGGFIRTETGWTPTVPATDVAPQPTVDPNYMLSSRLIQKINPPGPIEYNQQTEPVLIQTDKGSMLVAAPAGPIVGGTQASLPPILRADLPLDQKAYKPYAIPAINIQGLGEAKEIETAAPQQVTAGVNASGPIFYIAAGLVVLYILSKL